jgi:hypothetical protein
MQSDRQTSVPIWRRLHNIDAGVTYPATLGRTADHDDRGSGALVQIRRDASGEGE